jgi:hypothetical protein
MPVASSSMVALSYAEETNWGVTPSGPLKELRWTGESLALTTTNEVSAEVRADRQVPDVVRTGVDIQGDINIELSFGAFDDLLEGALMSNWSAPLAITGTNISADASDNSINSASGGLAGIIPGQWIELSGFTNAGNNGYFQATSVTANKVIVSGGTLVTEAAGATVGVGGSSLRNGVDPKSYTIEKAFTDIGEYVAFTGMRVASLNLTAETGAMITGAFSFQGKIAAATGSTVGTGPVVAAPGSQVFNTVDHIQGLRIGGQAVAFDVSSHNFTIDNTLRAQKAQGSLGNIGIGLGTLNVTGAVSAYFTSRTLYEKHLNWETSSFSFRIVDGAGNGYVFTFPALKFTDGNPVAGGKDQDIIAEMSWTAFRHPTLGYTVQVDRFSA